MKNKSENRIISHIVSLVLGIISVATILFWYLSLPTGITAIVLGAKSYKREGKALGLAGMITGIVGTALCFLVYVSLLIILIIANSAY